jgi:hypothetical protein
MDNRAPEMLRPTLLSGLLFGTLASLPYVKVLNACTCCSLVAGCGLLAAYLYSRDCRVAGYPFGASGGALVGLIAGAFFGITAGLVGILSIRLFGEPGLRWLLDVLQQNPDMPAEVFESIERAKEQMDDRDYSAGSIVLGVLSSVLLGAVFSTLGGLIGGALFPHTPPPTGRARLSPESSTTRDKS